MYRSRYSQNKSNTGYIIAIVMVVAVVIAALAVAFFIFDEDTSPLPLTGRAVIGGGEEPNGVSKVTASTLDIDATVEARVEQILAAQPTPNLDATVEARVSQKLAAQPTFIPQVIVKEVPLEIIKDVVREALAARVSTTAPPMSMPAFTTVLLLGLSGCGYDTERDKDCGGCGLTGANLIGSSSCIKT